MQHLHNCTIEMLLCVLCSHFVSHKLRDYRPLHDSKCMMGNQGKSYSDEFSRAFQFQVLIISLNENNSNVLRIY